MVESPLPKRVYAAYAAPILVLAMMFMTFYVYLQKFYTDHVKLDLNFLWKVLLVTRLFDAVIDPMIGSISDRTPLSWGRRKPWIAYGAVPLAVSFYFLVTPPTGAPQQIIAWWLAAWTFLFFVFFTMLTIPYEALGAEISLDYHERTRLLGLRDGVFLAGSLLAVVVPEQVGHFVTAATESDAEHRKYFILGCLYGGLLVAAIYWCVRTVPERPWTAEQRPSGGVLRNLRGITRNRPFIIVLTAYFANALGGWLPLYFFPYYVEHVLRSERSAIFLVLYLGVGFVMLPLWVVISGRFGRKLAWLLAMAVNTGAFSWVLFLGPGDDFWFAVLISLSGIGVGGTLAIPSAMQADVIDYDEWLFGKRREGLFVGIWLIARKLAAALSVGLGFLVLALVGYDPEAKTQAPETLWVLRSLYAGFPCVTSATAILIACWYPIDLQLHRRIRHEIDARNRPPA